MTPDPRPTAHPGPRKLLRCDACGRSAVFTDAEFFAFVVTGWPPCCGETMSLYLEATVPHPAAVRAEETTPPRPAPGARPPPE
jgi:hypothetical protein